MACLTEAITKYNLYFTISAGTVFLHGHFISQSAPDIQEKLQKLHQGSQTPQQDFLNAAFRVFNNKESEAKQEKEKHLIVKYQLLASVYMLLSI
jgi:hypothetical protein